MCLGEKGSTTMGLKVELVTRIGELPKAELSVKEGFEIIGVVIGKV